MRGRGKIEFQFSLIGLSLDLWNQMFQFPNGFEPPVWESLRLDALNAFPAIGTAVVLGATALEVFIAALLNELASRKGLSAPLWEWIRDRDKRTLQQPSVEEQFDVLLKEFTGHSLKEDAALWEAFKNLKAARNSFVHEGVARVGNTVLTMEAATLLVSKIDAITGKCREWIPDDMRWPVPQIAMEIGFTHTVVEPSKQVSEAKVPPA
jgi:hypothetical protein